MQRKIISKAGIIRQALRLWVGAAILAIVFLGWIWTSSLRNRDDSEEGPSSSYSKSALELAQKVVPSDSALDDVAETVGLRRSAEIQGYVDSRQRLADGLVQFSGWVVDKTGDGQPLTLIGFAGGKTFSVVQSSGRRPDVEAMYELSSVRAANLAFSLNFTGACKPGLSFMVVALNQKNQFALLPFYKMVPDCG